MLTYIFFKHIFIQIVYLDMVAPDHLEIPRGFPRIWYIKDEHLKWLNKVANNEYDLENLKVTKHTLAAYMLVNTCHLSCLDTFLCEILAFAGEGVQ